MALRALVAFAAVSLVTLAGSRFIRTPGVPTVTIATGRLVRSVTAEGVLRPVKSTPINVPGTLRQSLKIAWLLDDSTPVRAGELVAKLDAADAEKALRESEATLAQADERLGKAEARAGLSREVLGREAELAGRELEDARSFQSTDTEIYSRFEIATSAIDTELAAHRKEHADAVASARPEVTRSELDLLRIERRRAELDRGRAIETLSQLDLRAPHDGLVLLARRWNNLPPRVGDAVWPNEKLAEIPDSKALEAEIWVLEADAGGLAVGLTASVRLEGRQDEEIAARVRQIDAIAQPRQRGNQVQYFGAVAELDRLDPAFMKPGMRVLARIVVMDRPSVLVVPRQAVFDRDGTKIVFRRSAWGRFTRVEVETEAVGPDRVAILSGLEPGDVIALLDPEQMQKKTDPAPTTGPVIGGGT
jgi:multidrug efflux pump subunit AcrA (membrane-fusion protein)